MANLSGGNDRHVIIDLQRLFAEETVWHTPIIADILPNVLDLTAAFSHRTLFAKFMVPGSPHQASGRWRIYYERWSMLTTSSMDPIMQDLVAPLAAIATPETTIEKTTYSIFGVPGFEKRLHDGGVDTLVFSGVETDVCVLASIFDAVDAGFHVIVAANAVGSSASDSHQAILEHVLPRMPEQIGIWTTAEIVAAARA
jgi:nicotinamidase-related amidase